MAGGTGIAGKKPRNGAYTRRRGYSFERETVNFLREGGLLARRVPLSGAGEEKGDITVKPGYAADAKPLRGELKRKKELPAWITGPLGDHDFMAMRADSSETLVVIRLSLLRDLLQ